MEALAAQIQATQTVETGKAIQVSIIIPVHGNLKYTTACLLAIATHTPSSIFYEIIVVDDASPDDTQDFLKTAQEFYPRLRSVRLEKNSGFSTACNAGAAAAQGEFVLFLNNDTEPCVGWLQGVLKVFRNEPQAGVVGSLLIFPRRTDMADEPDRVQHCGVVFNAEKEALHIYKFCLSIQPFVRQTREYQAVTAACLMLPRELFTRVGGFSREYLNGGEDLDLCFKIRVAGHKVFCASDSVLRHHESVTVKSGYSYGNKNYRRFLEKWSSQIQEDEEIFYQRDGILTGCNQRIAMITPLRPLKTGVADYVEELLPALVKHARVDFFVDDFSPSNPEVLHHHFVHSLHDLQGADYTHRYDAVIYHIGNNPFHAKIYQLAANRPGIVVLHEYDCRGCSGEISSRRLLRGLLRRSQALIVHNEHSRQLLYREFPDLPSFVIPHLLSHKALQTDISENSRNRLKLPHQAFVIVSLGLVQLHKRNHITLAAFVKFACRHPQALLMLAGEAPDPAFRSYLNQQIQQHGLQDKVRITGWLSDEQFFDYLSAADVTVNLRYPARGEESGSLTRILGCGKPAIVSDYAQFASIPDDCVIKISFENEVAELVAAWDQLLVDPQQREMLSTRARDFYRAQNDVERIAATYAEACRQVGALSKSELQLRLPHCQFAADTRACIRWTAQVGISSDHSRPLILALSQMKVPVALQVLGEVERIGQLINPEDYARLEPLTRLQTAEQFVQIHAGPPAQFHLASGAFAVVGLVQSLAPGEADMWAKLPATLYWPVSGFLRDQLLAAGVAPTKVTLLPPGVPALSYGATVNQLDSSGPFRFICATNWSQGSGWEATLRAFLKEFSSQPMVRLLFKSTMCHLPTEEINRIYHQRMTQFLRENPEFRLEQFANISSENLIYNEDLMPAFYSSGQALVQPTLNGSGRRAVLEASALGLPVITTELGQWEPRGEPTSAYLVRVQIKNGRLTIDEIQLRELMRQLVHQRLESQLPGIRSRQQILATRTWETIAEQVAIQLSDLLESPSARKPEAQLGAFFDQ